EMRKYGVTALMLVCVLLLGGFYHANAATDSRLPTLKTLEPIIKLGNNPIFRGYVSDWGACESLNFGFAYYAASEPSNVKIFPQMVEKIRHDSGLVLMEIPLENLVLGEEYYFQSIAKTEGATIFSNEIRSFVADFPIEITAEKVYETDGEIFVTGDIEVKGLEAGEMAIICVYCWVENFPQFKTNVGNALLQATDKIIIRVREPMGPIGICFQIKGHLSRKDGSIAPAAILGKRFILKNKNQQSSYAEYEAFLFA
ncbi:MAG TPA: hypothetical protein PKM84_01160, partial [Candidatus Pacearchaeota archaeon]|nr:hypothetical protein [Candidatus Pacearchaeota archaeon]